MQQRGRRGRSGREDDAGGEGGRHTCVWSLTQTVDTIVHVVRETEHRGSIDQCFTHEVHRRGRDLSDGRSEERGAAERNACNEHQIDGDDRRLFHVFHWLDEV